MCDACAHAAQSLHARICPLAHFPATVLMPALTLCVLSFVSSKQSVMPGLEWWILQAQLPEVQQNLGHVGRDQVIRLYEQSKEAKVQLARFASCKRRMAKTICYFGLGQRVGVALLIQLARLDMDGDGNISAMEMVSFMEEATMKMDSTSSLMVNVSLISALGLSVMIPWLLSVMSSLMDATTPQIMALMEAEVYLLVGGIGGAIFTLICTIAISGLSAPLDIEGKMKFVLKHKKLVGFLSPLYIIIMSIITVALCVSLFRSTMVSVTLEVVGMVWLALLCFLPFFVLLLPGIQQVMELHHAEAVTLTKQLSPRQGDR